MEYVLVLLSDALEAVVDCSFEDLAVSLQAVEAFGQLVNVLGVAHCLMVYHSDQLAELSYVL